MCCCVNLFGTESDEGTHLSMFIHAIQGDYDDIILWPFRGDLTLSIMDQGTSNKKMNVSEKLIAHSSLKMFRRPNTSKSNEGYGFAEMISHQMLHNNLYIKDDCIKIKIEAKTE